MKKMISCILAVCLIFSFAGTALAEINLGAFDDNSVTDLENYNRNLEKEAASESGDTLRSAVAYYSSNNLMW